jgi:hypothetical protein
MPGERVVPDELERLENLRDRGVLTAKEFEAQKELLLEVEPEVSDEPESRTSRSNLRRTRSRDRLWRWLRWVVLVVVVVAIVIGVPQIRSNIPGISGWFGGNPTALRGYVLDGQYPATSRGQACNTANVGYGTTVTLQDNLGSKVAAAGLSEGSVQSAGPSAASSPNPDVCVFTFLATVPTGSPTVTITIGTVQSLTFPTQDLRDHHWSVVINLGNT